MAVTLIATPGAANANSYSTLAEADDYNASNTFVSDWTAADDTTKIAALIEAARRLDASFDWTGAAVDDVQAMGWPRSGMFSRNKFAIAPTVIPDLLKFAQAEFARRLIAADTAEDNDAAKLGITNVKAGSVSVSFADQLTKSSSLDLRNADVIAASSAFAWMSKIIPDAVRNLIPDSWYLRRSVSEPLIFEVTR